MNLLGVSCPVTLLSRVIDVIPDRAWIRGGGGAGGAAARLREEEQRDILLLLFPPSPQTHPTAHCLLLPPVDLSGAPTQYSALICKRTHALCVQLLSTVNVFKRKRRLLPLQCFSPLVFFFFNSICPGRPPHPTYVFLELLLLLPCVHTYVTYVSVEEAALPDQYGF